MTPIKPGTEHQWLQKLEGNWTVEASCDMGPDKPRETFKSTETVRSIGGMWMVCEGTGEMPGGGKAVTQMTLGYDPAKGRYVGTFIGSMMNNMWVYEGTLDAAGKVLTLETEGPSFTTEGATAKYRDAVEWKSDDERVLSSNMLREDGTWHCFMEATYRRAG